MRVCAYQRQDNVLCWRLLSTVMGHCRHTELQKERGILRFPDFSLPSPPRRFHNTTDSEPRRRRRHAPGVLPPRVHPRRAASPRIQLDAHKVSTSTRVSWRRFRTFGTRLRAPPLGLPGQASERCLAQAENEASFSARLFPRLETRSPGDAACFGAAPGSSLRHGSTQRRLALLLKRVRSKFELRCSAVSGCCALCFNIGTPSCSWTRYRSPVPAATERNLLLQLCSRRDVQSGNKCSPRVSSSGAGSPRTSPAAHAVIRPNEFVCARRN